MSGIAGIFNRDGRPVDPGLLARMIDAIAHRGPDGAGHWVDGYMGFGHQMLCTTPESLRERQPLRDETGQLCLVLDGRVDNRAELKAAIEARGTRLSDDTDAELVLRAYQVWGEECAREIIGDFAFAVWDGRKQQLFCARDFLGIKPFYYHVDEHTFRFGSELRQILEDPAIRRRPNEGMIGEYLANAITSQEETLYQGIMRLPPAHSLIVRTGYVQKQRYWSPDFSKNIRCRDDDEYAEHFLAIFKEAIRCRLRSVGPVGIALSGGLDSSSIACVAKSLYREAGDVDPDFVALSEIFPGQDCDETAYIQDVVHLWDLKSFTVQRTGANTDVFSEQVQRYLDFPGYPNSTIAAPMSTLTREQGLRVLLDGLGGDEWFSGTSYYYADMISRLRVRALLQHIRLDVASIGVMSTLSQLLWHGVNPLLPQLVRNAAKWALRKYSAMPSWVDPGFARRIRLAERIRCVPARSSFSHVARDDIWRTSTDGFHAQAFEIEECAASWLGFERRHPFHDRRLVEFALALPEEQRYRQGWIKYILRIAMEDYLPETVRQRWDKAEFSIVFGHMLEGPAMARLFDMLTVASLSWVDRHSVRDMYQKMSQLYRQGDDGYKPYVWKLWTIAGVEIWYNTAFLNRSPLEDVEQHARESDNQPALVVT
jgi:asparagine synthase (glutamine-hydrolysing)